MGWIAKQKAKMVADTQAFETRKRALKALVLANQPLQREISNTFDIFNKIMADIKASTPVRESDAAKRARYAHACECMDFIEQQIKAAA